MLRPAPECKVLLEPVESLFTKPGYRYFYAFVLVYAPCGPACLWVTKAVLSDLPGAFAGEFFRAGNARAPSRRFGVPRLSDG